MHSSVILAVASGFLLVCIMFIRNLGSFREIPACSTSLRRGFVLPRDCDVYCTVYRAKISFGAHSDFLIHFIISLNIMHVCVSCC